MTQEKKPLQVELRKSSPFASDAEEGVIALLRTSDYIRRQISNLLTTYDITPQQYNVLRILRGAGTEGLNTLEVGERMIEQSPGVTRLIDRLEQKALVERVRSHSDRRCISCRITGNGLQILSSLDEPIDRINRALMQQLTKEEKRTLVALLDRIRR